MLGNCQISEVLDSLRDASASPQRLTLDARDLPTCQTDVQLLNVILSNLMDNALKYSPVESTVSISATAEVQKGNAGLSISVCNQPGAAGLPDPGQVFNKYYRAPGAHGRTGSGLGLHISEGFARKLGGALRYEPGLDAVKFVLWIPL